MKVHPSALLLPLSVLTTSLVVGTVEANCKICSNKATKNMLDRDLTCETADVALIQRCNKDPVWRGLKICQKACYDVGRGYDGDVCCDANFQVTKAKPKPEPIVVPKPAPVPRPVPRPTMPVPKPTMPVPKPTMAMPKPTMPVPRPTNSEKNDEVVQLAENDMCTEMCKDSAKFCKQYDIDEFQCLYYRDVVCCVDPELFQPDGNAGNFNNDVSSYYNMQLSGPTAKPPPVPRPAPRPVPAPVPVKPQQHPQVAAKEKAEMAAKEKAEMAAKEKAEMAAKEKAEMAAKEKAQKEKEQQDKKKAEKVPAPEPKPPVVEEDTSGEKENDEKACIGPDSINSRSCSLLSMVQNIDCCDGYNCEDGIGCFPMPREAGNPCHMNMFGDCRKTGGCCGKGLICENTGKYATLRFDVAIGECVSSQKYGCPSDFTGLYPYDGCTGWIWCKQGEYQAGPRSCPEGSTHRFDIESQICRPANQVSCGPLKGLLSVESVNGQPGGRALLNDDEQNKKQPLLRKGGGN